MNDTQPAWDDDYFDELNGFDNEMSKAFIASVEQGAPLICVPEAEYNALIEQLAAAQAALALRMAALRFALNCINVLYGDGAEAGYWKHVNELRAMLAEMEGANDE